ncbi:hypothetical protein [Enterococcus sp. DIV1059_2]|uniref:hypothetical protein n=1 Tax=Enterococcus sp. DIV1059_2 TaxID=2774664 RepID=UPI003F2212F4
MLNMRVLDYQISSDENSVSVSKARISEKNGNEVSTLVGHYPTLEMAMRGVQKHYTLGAGTEIKTIEDYRTALTEVQEAFKIELKLEENKND